MGPVLSPPRHEPFRANARKVPATRTTPSKCYTSPASGPVDGRAGDPWSGHSAGCDQRPSANSSTSASSISSGATPEAIPPRLFAAAQLLPRATCTARGTERFAGGPHDLLGHLCHLVGFLDTALDQYLVVDLQHDPARHPASLQGSFEPHEGHLEDVGRQTLYAGVHRLALGGLAHAVVGAVQLGKVAAPAEQRLGVPLARASATVRDMYSFTFGKATK